MPNLVERSVINLGQGSCVICLPKPWLRFYGIKPGDKLEVISNGKLIIRPKNGTKRIRRKQNERYSAKLPRGSKSA
jgi:bifunctional DNA-binding transcriptional regulator/antitoxin component of YhaV-PrlF toxin-antitoxin module